eukprot:TRINITY_DN549_c1_g2_i5.p1 TRINITY_DN549_c1_g2~~TRINITY_DN549_c1_g2_i5.p1  ORF type:complete len:794 (+),score=177.97 TRINITY_DN549_c1_g2_i5:623-3004(+)
MESKRPNQYGRKRHESDVPFHPRLKKSCPDMERFEERFETIQKLASGLKMPDKPKSKVEEKEESNEDASSSQQRKYSPTLDEISDIDFKVGNLIEELELTTPQARILRQFLQNHKFDPKDLHSHDWFTDSINTAMRNEDAEPQNIDGCHFNKFQAVLEGILDCLGTDPKDFFYGSDLKNLYSHVYEMEIIKTMEDSIQHIESHGRRIILLTVILSLDETLASVGATVNHLQCSIANYKPPLDNNPNNYSTAAVFGGITTSHNSRDKSFVTKSTGGLDIKNTETGKHISEAQLKREEQWKKQNDSYRYLRTFLEEAKSIQDGFERKMDNGETCLVVPRLFCFASDFHAINEIYGSMLNSCISCVARKADLNLYKDDIDGFIDLDKSLRTIASQKSAINNAIRIINAGGKISRLKRNEADHAITSSNIMDPLYDEEFYDITCFIKNKTSILSRIGYDPLHCGKEGILKTVTNTCVGALLKIEEETGDPTIMDRFSQKLGELHMVENGIPSKRLEGNPFGQKRTEGNHVLMYVQSAAYAIGTGSDIIPLEHRFREPLLQTLVQARLFVGMLGLKPMSKQRADITQEVGQKLVRKLTELRRIIGYKDPLVTSSKFHFICSHVGSILKTVGIDVGKTDEFESGHRKLKNIFKRCNGHDDAIQQILRRQMRKHIISRELKYRTKNPLKSNKPSIISKDEPLLTLKRIFPHIEIPPGKVIGFIQEENTSVPQAVIQKLEFKEEENQYGSGVFVLTKTFYPIHIDKIQRRLFFSETGTNLYLRNSFILRIEKEYFKLGIYI